MDYYFAQNKKLFANNSDEPFNAQRLQDKAVAQNQTLDWLIPNLAFNITISLLHDPLLTRNTTARVKRAAIGNVFEFAWRNLAIAYSLACAATIVVNILGWYAYRENGAAFDSSFSTIVSATRGADLDNVFPKCCQGVLPIPRESLDATVQVRRIEGNLRGRRIIPIGTPVVVCEICNRPAAARAVSGDRRSSLRNGWRRRRMLGSNSPATPEEIELPEAQQVETS